MPDLSIPRIRKIVRNEVFEGASANKLAFVFSVLLAPFSVIITSILSISIGYISQDGSVVPNSVAEVAEAGIGIDRILSALLLAPLVENFICYIWYVFLRGWRENYWWSKPAFIAGIAALFHAVLLWDLRPMAVFPGFFIMATLIVHSVDKRIGYLASVLHHFCVNLINLSLAYWMGTF